MKGNELIRKKQAVMKTNYENLLYRSHPVSSARAQMPVRNRAAQFSPFAALTGYEEAVAETARLTESFIELDEYDKAILDEKIKKITKKTEVRIKYFEPDKRKEGGRYLCHSGFIKKIDEYEHCIIMSDGTKIRKDRVVEIEFA